MRKLRVGILGTSWWTDVVWPGFSTAENAEITWIAARTGAKAEVFAREHGIPRWCASYEELIAAPDVDAVFVGVPNFLHHELAMAALRAGKHVLQEKPMALSAVDAAAQARLSRQLGLTLTVNQEVRLADGVRDLREAVSASVGALRKLCITLTLATAEWTGWRSDPDLSGDTLFEMIVHELDMARWMWRRDPVAVTAIGDDVAGNDLTVVLEFGGGDSAVIDVCWRSSGFRMAACCTGDRGTLTREYDLNRGDGVQTVVTDEGRDAALFEAGIQGGVTFRRMMEGFAAAALEGAVPPVSPEDGVWAVQMAEAARDSLRSGRRVSIAQPGAT